MASGQNHSMESHDLLKGVLDSGNWIFSTNSKNIMSNFTELKYNVPLLYHICIKLSTQSDKQPEWKNPQGRWCDSAYGPDQWKPLDHQQHAANSCRP